MSTKTTRNRSGPAARASVRPGRILAALAAVLLVAAPTAAQEVCDESAGTLGIQGLRCEGCTFSMSEEGITRARFRTEPQIIAIARGFTRGDRLRAGDRIVAIDDQLITTRAGSNRLVELQAGQEVALRIRRDGRVEDLRVVAGSACALHRAVEETEIEVEIMDDRDMPPLPPGYIGVRPPPPTTEAPLPPSPAMPAMPAMPPIPPSGYLGFGIKCGPCGIRDGARFFDENPPVVTNVAEDSPADEAGLEPDDVILAIDGADITSDEGGERFSEIEPGDRVELTIRRGDERRTVTLEVGERVVRRPAPGVMAPPAPSPRRWSVRPDTLAFGDQPLTFENTPLYIRNEQGEVMIILRDAPITIQRDDATGEIVIRSGRRVIRLNSGGSGASSDG